MTQNLNHLFCSVFQGTRLRNITQYRALSLVKQITVKDNLIELRTRQAKGYAKNEEEGVKHCKLEQGLPD